MHVTTSNSPENQYVVSVTIVVFTAVFEIYYMSVFVTDALHKIFH